MMLASRVGTGRAAGRPRAGRRYQPAFDRLEGLVLLAGNAVLRWNQVALDAVAADTLPGHGEQAGPTRCSRALAMVQLAVFDAANSINHQYQPYLMARRFPADASVAAAVAWAAHDTLSALYPRQGARFDEALTAELGRVPDGRAENLGRAAGRLAARRMLAARAGDGPASSSGGTEPEGLKPGVFHTFPGEPSPVTPAWGSLKPFGIRSVHRIAVTPPPAMSSVAYAAAYREVQELGGDGVHTPTVRTAEQTMIGKFWGYDGAPGLGYPPRLYNQIVDVLAKQEHLGVLESARLFAMADMAMADAGIVCWGCKYDFDVWRPIRGIRQVGPDGQPLDDGNPMTQADPNFTPLGAPCTNCPPGRGDFTPPFPSYSSGHASFGAAVFRTLADFFHKDRMTFTVVSDEFNGVNRDVDGTVRPLLPRVFHSFRQASEENGQSRIYLGIHWSFDKTGGIAAGNQIADRVARTMLRPLGR